MPPFCVRYRLISAASEQADMPEHSPSNNYEKKAQHTGIKPKPPAMDAKISSKGQPGTGDGVCDSFFVVLHGSSPLVIPIGFRLRKV